MYELVLDQAVYKCTMGGWKQRLMQNLDSCSPFMAKHVLVISIFHSFSVMLSIVTKKCINRNKKTKTEVRCGYFVCLQARVWSSRYLWILSKCSFTLTGVLALCTLDPLLSPHPNDCKFSYQMFPQSLKSRIKCFRTLEQLSKISSIIA